MTIDAARALRASGGALVGDALPAELRFSTDTRSLAPGDVFVALRGERFDGHDYLAAAFAAGASAAVVDDARTLPAGASGIVVANTTHAYLAFASVARARSSARVAAITGSAGKTTTKAFLAHILERAAPGRTIATPRNENNEIGVAKLLLGVPESAAFVVVELGARHFGEIETLARAALPETAAVTNIGEAHLEIFGSHERLADTKFGIFATGARRVLGMADATSRAYAVRENATAVWFGVDGDPAAPLGATSVCVGRSGLRVAADGTTTTHATGVAVPGDHNLRNVAAAAAIAVDLGIAPDAIAASLASLALPDGRYERMTIAGLDGVAFIYDAYNANRSGMVATLASFARESATRKIAVLASMAELGAEASAMHRDVGAIAAASDLTTLLVGGDFADDLAAGARANGMTGDAVVAFGDNAVAVAWLREHVRPGDLVLLKGSRKYRLENVIGELRGVHAG